MVNSTSDTKKVMSRQRRKFCVAYVSRVNRPYERIFAVVNKLVQFRKEVRIISP